MKEKSNMTKHHYPARVLGPTLVRPHHHPPPPKVLAKEEQVLWDSIYGEYQIEGTAAMNVLLKACNASATERMAMEMIRREGVMVEGKPHPLLKSATEARNSFLSCLRALGIDLGPAR
jgi:hypothetical protein